MNASQSDRDASSVQASVDHSKSYYARVIDSLSLEYVTHEESANVRKVVSLASRNMKRLIASKQFGAILDSSPMAFTPKKELFRMAMQMLWQYLPNNKVRVAMMRMFVKRVEKVKKAEEERERVERELVESCFVDGCDVVSECPQVVQQVVPLRDSSVRNSEPVSVVCVSDCVVNDLFDDECECPSKNDKEASPIASPIKSVVSSVKPVVCDPPCSASVSASPMLVELEACPVCLGRRGMFVCGCSLRNDVRLGKKFEPKVVPVVEFASPPRIVCDKPKLYDGLEDYASGLTPSDPSDVIIEEAVAIPLPVAEPKSPVASDNDVCELSNPCDELGSCVAMEVVPVCVPEVVEVASNPQLVAEEVVSVVCSNEVKVASVAKDVPKRASKKRKSKATSDVAKFLMSLSAQEALDLGYEGVAKLYKAKFNKRRAPYHLRAGYAELCSAANSVQPLSKPKPKPKPKYRRFLEELLEEVGASGISLKDASKRYRQVTGARNSSRHFRDAYHELFKEVGVTMDKKAMVCDNVVSSNKSCVSDNQVESVVSELELPPIDFSGDPPLPDEARVTMNVAVPAMFTFTTPPPGFNQEDVAKVNVMLDEELEPYMFRALTAEEYVDMCSLELSYGIQFEVPRSKGVIIGQPSMHVCEVRKKQRHNVEVLEPKPCVKLKPNVPSPVPVHSKVDGIKLEQQCDVDPLVCDSSKSHVLAMDVDSSVSRSDVPKPKNKRKRWSKRRRLRAKRKGVGD